MDYSWLVDVGVAAAIAIGLKREFTAFRAVVEKAIDSLNDTTSALASNMRELTKVEDVQDVAISRLFDRVGDLEDYVKEIRLTTKAIAVYLEESVDAEDTVEDALWAEKEAGNKKNN